MTRRIPASSRISPAWPAPRPRPVPAPASIAVGASMALRDPTSSATSRAGSWRCPRARARGWSSPAPLPLEHGFPAAASPGRRGSTFVFPCSTSRSSSGSRWAFPRNGSASTATSSPCRPPNGSRPQGATLSRIGVFVCHCGENIGRTVDVRKSLPVKTLPGFAARTHYKYMCLRPGRSMIREAIREQKLTGSSSRPARCTNPRPPRAAGGGRAERRSAARWSTSRSTARGSTRSARAATARPSTSSGMMVEEGQAQRRLSRSASR